MFLKVIGTLVTLPLLFFLPGYALAGGRLSRPDDSPWIERLLMVVALSASIASLVALLMAELGYLRIWLLNVVLFTVAVCSRLLPGRGSGFVLGKRPGRLETVVILALVALSLVMFFRPAEFVVGEGDPGYYFNIGYQVAESGSMNVYDESVREMDDDEIKAFFYDETAQFLPFHLRDRDTGRIQPLLYHLLPAWIGVFVMLTGKWGGFYVVPVFALLAMLALFALARRLSGLAGAAAAGALGTVFFLQVWFSRAPVSEIFCQFFILCSILFFLNFLDTGDIAPALCSALSLTAASTARPEAAVVIFPMLLIMALRMFRSLYRAGDYVFANTALAGLACVLVYIRLAEYEYVSVNFRKATRLFGENATMGTVLLACGVLIAFCFLFFNLRPLNRYLVRVGRGLDNRLGARPEAVSRVTRGSMSLVALATFVYLCRLSPEAAPTMNSPQRIFVNTSLFFGGLTVMVFVVGFCLMVYETPSTSASFLLASVTVVLAVALQGSRLALGNYPWDSRRLMLLVVPLLMVGFGYLFARLMRAGRVELRVLSVLAFAGFFALFCYHAAPIRGHVEYRGADRQLSSLAGRMEGDVVVFTDRFSGEVLGIPLRYQHHVDARKVYSLKNAERFETIVRKYAGKGKKVLIELGGVAKEEVRFNQELRERLDFKEAFRASVRYPRLAPVASGRPKDIIEQELDLTFYAVEPR